jgi:hypothetical protein
MTKWWFGHIATGLAWAVVMAMISIHQTATKKARAEIAANTLNDRR